MKQLIFKIIAIIIFVFNVLFLIISWYEYYKVEILKEIDNYPFGGEGPVPYYYKSSEMYAQVNLIWGIIFFFNLILLITSLISKKRNFKITMFISTLALIIIDIINGLIGEI